MRICLRLLPSLFSTRCRAQRPSFPARLPSGSRIRGSGSMPLLIYPSRILETSNCSTSIPLTPQARRALRCISLALGSRTSYRPRCRRCRRVRSCHPHPRLCRLPRRNHPARRPPRRRHRHLPRHRPRRRHQPRRHPCRHLCRLCTAPAAGNRLVVEGRISLFAACSAAPSVIPSRRSISARPRATRRRPAIHLPGRQRMRSSIRTFARCTLRRPPLLHMVSTSCFAPWHYRRQARLRRRRRLRPPRRRRRRRPRRPRRRRRPPPRPPLCRCRQARI